MWNNSNFGDSVTNSGAGFLNTSLTNAGAPAKGKGVRRSQSVVPLCVRQIRDHPEEEFKLFGMATQIVTIVGILKELDAQSTKVTYEIEDHTGRIKAVWWLENDNTSTNLPVVKEGCYVRVYGSLRTQEGEKLLMVLKMFPVNNANEITTHLLEVIHTRLEAEELTKNPVSLAANIKNNPGAELANSMSYMYNDVEAPAASSSELTAVQQKVYRILQPINSTSGLHRSNIWQQFQPHQHREVDAALEFLINEGHAYSTIDNDHFKATDSM